MKVFDPSTSPKSILYVEESFNLDINKFIVENYQQIVKSFEEDFNINFLYLPYVLKDESYMEQLQYNHPTFDPAKLDEVDIHDIYQDLINGEGKTGIGCALLSYDDNKSEQSELFYQFDNVENLIAQFKYFAKASRKHSIDKTYQGSSMTHFLTSDKFSDSKEEDNYLKEDLENIIKRMIEKGALKTVYLAIESTIIRNMPISKIRISKDYRIFLIDHRSGTLPTEVEMTPLAKTLFIFYLNLQDGESVSFKELYDHKDKLINIYGRLTNRDDLQKQNDTIDNLADQLFSKTINSLSSNIKTSFTDILPESSASNYYISQKGRGLDRRIKLPRELVEREDDLRR